MKLEHHAKSASKLRQAVSFVLFACFSTLWLIASGFDGSARAAAAVSSEVLTTEGKTLVVLANPFMELTFEPARGGRCVSFRFRDNGEQLVAKSEEAGMFLDHWAKYPWPSGLMHLPYQFEVVGDRNSKVGIKLWVTVPPKGGGSGSPNREASLALPTSPELIGLVVRKTIWLNAANDALLVEQEVENPTKESRGVAPYVQHNFNMNGSRFNDVWYLPSTEGVSLNFQPTREGERSAGTEWVVQPTAGWIAVRDRKTDRGMLFAFDYNYIRKIYTCGSTAEWFMEAVPVAPGKSLKTHHIIKPVKGFESFVYGSENLVTDLRPHQVGTAVEVAHDIAAVSRELGKVDIEFTAVGWKSKEVLSQRSLKSVPVGFQKARQTFTFVPKNLADGVVIKAVVKGDNFTERYERFYAGDKAEHERTHNYFATVGGALAGGQGDAYALKPPRKVKKLDKPDFATLAHPSPDRFRCLVVFGLYTHVLNLDDALQGWQPAGKPSVEFTWANCPTNAIESFPGSYEELFAYNTVVLSDVNYKAIGDIGFEMLCDYVEHGGNLLVTGGPYALGNGEFEGTRFLDVLPVTLSSAFDLKWAGKGKSRPLTAARDDSQLLIGVSFTQKPRVFWHHCVTPKEGSEVVLKAGEQPALILGRYGKGKVAVLTLSPTGKANEGEVAWWAWEGWPMIVKNVFAWFASAP